MTDEASPACKCVVDCAGLHEIAGIRSDNLKTVFTDGLSSGEIGVLSVVWNEFKGLYEDEAAAIEQFIALKITMKREYHAGAASIADGLNSGFSRGPYDSETDLYTASVASLEGYVVLTSSSQASYYKKMDCDVSDLAGWAEQQS